MRHRLFAHVVWTTRDRAPLIDRALAEFLVRFLGRMARDGRADMMAIGIVASHLHLLLRLHPGTNLPAMIQRMKGGSARLAAREHLNSGSPLRWAKGYCVESVSRRAVAAVADYVLGQSERHPNHAIPDWRPPAPSLAVTWFADGPGTHAQ